MFNLLISVSLINSGVLENKFQIVNQSHQFYYVDVYNKENEWIDRHVAQPRQVKNVYHYGNITGLKVKFTKILK